MSNRIDQYTGSTEDYISYLETLIKSMREHHSRCHSEACEESQNQCRATSCPPISVQDPIRRHGYTHTERLSDVQTPFAPQSSSPKARRYDIILCRPNVASQQSKRRKTASSTCQWKKEAKALVNSTPKANEWRDTLKRMGLYEIMSSGKVASYLLEGDCPPPLPSGAGVYEQLSCDLTGRLRQYAHSALNRKTVASLMLKLANFQQLILLSSCAVLREGKHIPMSDLLDIVKIVLGQRSDRYCNRILDTVIYLNRLIDALNAHGWENRAAELLLLWDRKPCSYYLLACSAKDSVALLKNELTAEEFILDEGEARWTPLFIPTLISQIFDWTIPVTQISAALGYKHPNTLALNPWQIFC